MTPQRYAASGQPGVHWASAWSGPQNRILFQTKIRKKSLQCLITHAWRNERQCRMLSSRLVCRWIISTTEKVDTKSHYGGCTFYSRPRKRSPRASKGEARVPMPDECKEHRCGGCACSVYGLRLSAKSPRLVPRPVTTAGLPGNRLILTSSRTRQIVSKRKGSPSSSTGVGHLESPHRSACATVKESST